MAQKSLAEMLTGARLIIGTALVSIVAFAGRYAEGWFTDWQGPPDPPGMIDPADNILADHSSRSLQRNKDPETGFTWRVPLVTNRTGRQLPAPLRSKNSVESSQDRLPGENFAEHTARLLRQPPLRFAACDVQIPPEHRRGVCTLDGGDPQCSTVTRMYGVTEDHFFEQIRSGVSQLDEPDVLVFVHGFNVTCEEAVARAAQLGEDLPFHGLVIAYSWPSFGEADRYTDDEFQAENRFWGLGRLLAELRDRLPQETRLHVLAHSMGNRVTLRSLAALTGALGPDGAPQMGRLSSRLVSEYPSWAAWCDRPSRGEAPALESLIMAAPDVAEAEFRELAGLILPHCRRAVLYASDTDVAMEGSLHRNQEGFRAGDTRAHIELPGLRVIHFSGVSRIDPLGHSYYGCHPRVLDQIARLLTPSQIRPDMTMEEIAALYSIGSDPGTTRRE